MNNRIRDIILLWEVMILGDTGMAKHGVEVQLDSPAWGKRVTLFSRNSGTLVVFFKSFKIALQ
jgi:hypothetical protein